MLRTGLSYILAADAPSRTAIALALTLVLIVIPSGAATIVLDSVLDENADSPANGTCTLREAVLAANGNIAIDAGVAAGPAFTCPSVDQKSSAYVAPISRSAFIA